MRQHVRNAAAKAFEKNPDYQRRLQEIITLASLSSDEKRLMEYAAQGFTSRQCADIFRYAEITIKKKLCSVFEKAGICDRTDFFKKLGLKGLDFPGERSEQKSRKKPKKKDLAVWDKAQGIYDSLSELEKSFVQCVASGYTLCDIQEELCIPDGKAPKLLETICKKFGLQVCTLDELMKHIKTTKLEEYIGQPQTAASDPAATPQC